MKREKKSEKKGKKNSLKHKSQFLTLSSYDTKTFSATKFFFLYKAAELSLKL